MQKSLKTLSCCMIVKNEEHFLSGALESIKDLVDEIIIVDTGSTDKTVDIAKKYTDKIFFHKWEENFSKARNISLSYAKSDYILILDADERLDPKESIKIREKINTSNFEAFYFTVYNLYEENNELISKLNSIRIFKNGAGSYTRAIHNQLEIKGKIENTNFSVYHYGYGLKKDKIIKKAERSLKILYKELKNNSDKTAIYMYIANTLRGIQKFSDAVTEAKKGIKICKKTKKFGINYIMLNLYAGISLMLLNNINDAQKYFDNIIIKVTDYPDPYYYLGIIEMQKNNSNDAIKIFQTFLDLHANLNDEIIKKYQMIETIQFIPNVYLYLAAIYEKLKNNNKAIENYKKSISLNPKNIEVIFKYSVLLAKTKNFKKALENLKKIEKIKPDDLNTILLTADLYWNMKEKKQAIKYYNKAIDIKPELRERLLNWLNEQLQKGA